MGIISCSMQFRRHKAHVTGAMAVTGLDEQHKLEGPDYKPLTAIRVAADAVSA